MKKTYGAIFFMSLNLLLPISNVSAAETRQVFWNDNQNAQDYYEYLWTEPVQNYLENETDGLMKVSAIDTFISVEYYKKDTYQFISAKQIEFELPIFGGFYNGESNYYVVYGQENLSEDNNVEVLRIVKYDKKWNRISSTSLYGINTTIPFDAGSLRMAESAGVLYIRTSHEMYKSYDGQNHQANMAISVDEEQMEILNANYKVENISTGYVSHSFNQFIISDQNGNIVALDQGDGHPRAAVLGIYGECGKRGTSGYLSEDLIWYVGEIGENYTGASIGGLEYSSSSYLTVGNSVIQDEKNREYDVRNIYITSTLQSDIGNNNSCLTWITSYDKKGEMSTSTPQLVKLDDNTFIVMWSQIYEGEPNGKISYVFVDGAGNLTSKIYTKKGGISDCKPIVVDGKVVWWVADNKKLTFYSLDKKGNLSSAESKVDSSTTIYPVQIKYCTFVCKKIGTLPYDTVELEYYADYYSLYIGTRELQYNVDYKFGGAGGISYDDGPYYLRRLSFEGTGGYVYGSYNLEPATISSAPTLSTVKKTKNGAKLTWTKENCALGYYVYRKIGTGKYRRIATIKESDKNTYVDRSWKKGKQYSYYIKSYTTNGKKYISSKKSNVIKIK